MSLEEIRKEFFGDRKHVFVVYGEPNEVPKLSGVLSQSPTLVEFQAVRLSESDQRMLAMGLYPVMLVTYDYRFTRDMQAPEVPAYLAGAQCPENVPYTFTTYAVSEAYASFAYAMFLAHLKPRECIEDSETRRRNYIYDVKRDETLQLAYFAIDPIPGKLAQS